MDSALATSSTLLPFQKPSRNPLLLRSHFLHFSSNHFSFAPQKPHKPYSRIFITAYISSNSTKNTSNGSNKGNPSSRILQNAAKTLILTVTATLMAAKFKEMPAMAKIDLLPITETIKLGKKEFGESTRIPSGSLNPDIVKLLRELLEIKLFGIKFNKGEDEEKTLNILCKLINGFTSKFEWMFLLMKLFIEMGRIQEAQLVLEHLFESSFECTLVMVGFSERDLMIAMFEEALNFAAKAKDEKNVRLIMAHTKFLQKNLIEALKCYKELIEEYPEDFRSYLCVSIIYQLLHKEAEAMVHFEKYIELRLKSC